MEDRQTDIRSLEAVAMATKGLRFLDKSHLGVKLSRAEDKALRRGQSCQDTSVFSWINVDFSCFLGGISHVLEKFLFLRMRNVVKRVKSSSQKAGNHPQKESISRWC